MRDAFADALCQAASKNPKIRIVVADISPAGSMARFREDHPERFINVGVAEQSMIGICAGLALEGLKPFAYTIAPFALYRPFEMVRDDLCYQNLPVTVVGMGAGLVYSALGSTHHAQEDVAVASALPNMQIIAPCDPHECREAVAHCAAQSKGPVYLRLGKSGEPTFDSEQEFVFGKLRYLSRGEDICILSYGPIIRKAFDAANRLARQGSSVAVVSCHTLKPLDRAGIEFALQHYRQVIVIEEHSVCGGLAAQVRQIAQEIGSSTALKTFSLKDEFIQNYGSHDDLLAAHGLKDIVL